MTSPGCSSHFCPATTSSICPDSQVRYSRVPGVWTLLYRLGRPVQYSYAAAQLWHVQLGYASRPWAAEMPSAGRPLRWELLLALHQRGVRLTSVTHAAGLSSTGDPALDAVLPLPERFEIPEATVRAVAAARVGGGRVVAVGTSAARALEGSATQHGGILAAGAGETDLLLGPGYWPRVADSWLVLESQPGDDRSSAQGPRTNGFHQLLKHDRKDAAKQADRRGDSSSSCAALAESRPIAS